MEMSRLNELISLAALASFRLAEAEVVFNAAANARNLAERDLYQAEQAAGNEYRRLRNDAEALIKGGASNA
jgi:hypothetical protein